MSPTSSVNTASLADTTTNLTNVSTTTTKPWPTWDPVLLAYWMKEHYIKMGACVFLILLALVATILAIISLHGVRKFWPFGFVCILSSLFVSLLINAFYLLIRTIQLGHKRQWLMGDFLCRIYIFLQEGLRGAILYQVMMIVAYMVLSIRRPGWTQWLDTRRGSAILLAVYWLLIFVFNAEALASGSAETYQSGYSSCHSRGRTFHHWTIRVYVEAIFLIYTPCLLLPGLAGYLYYCIRQEGGLQYHRMDSGRSSCLNFQEIFRVSLVLAVLYTVCNAMLAFYFTFWLAKGSFPRTFTFWFIKDIAFLLDEACRAVLPLVFVFCFADLRRELKSNLCRIVGRASPVYIQEIQYKKSFESDTTEDGTA